ncbi:GDSL-type esterase/lipase family protein [Terrisporobacter sp.]
MSRLKRKKLRKKNKKRIILVILSLMLTALALGVTAISKEVTSPKTIPHTPKPSNIKKESINLDGYLFIGDSYTVLLGETIKKHNSNALIKAVSGVQPGYWLEHFSELPKNSEVKGVVLLIGVNGATYSDNIPNKEKLIDSLVKKYKSKTIYVQEVFPVGKHFESADPENFNEAIDKNNETTKKYCNHYDNVFYIDATNNLITEDGYLKFTNDGLHISSHKQETFYKNIVSAVNKIK